MLEEEEYVENPENTENIEKTFQRKLRKTEVIQEESEENIKLFEKELDLFLNNLIEKNINHNNLNSNSSSSISSRILYQSNFILNSFNLPSFSNFSNFSKNLIRNITINELKYSFFTSFTTIKSFIVENNSLNRLHEILFSKKFYRFFFISLIILLQIIFISFKSLYNSIQSTNSNYYNNLKKISLIIIYESLTYKQLIPILFLFCLFYWLILLLITHLILGFNCYSLDLSESNDEKENEKSSKAEQEKVKIGSIVQNIKFLIMQDRKKYDESIEQYIKNNSDVCTLLHSIGIFDYVYTKQEEKEKLNKKNLIRKFYEAKKKTEKTILRNNLDSVIKQSEKEKEKEKEEKLDITLANEEKDSYLFLIFNPICFVSFLKLIKDNTSTSSSSPSIYSNKEEMKTDKIFWIIISLFFDFLFLFSEFLLLYSKNIYKKLSKDNIISRKQAEKVKFRVGLTQKILIVMSFFTMIFLYKKVLWFLGLSEFNLILSKFLQVIICQVVYYFISNNEYYVLSNFYTKHEKKYFKEKTKRIACKILSSYMGLYTIVFILMNMDNEVLIKSNRKNIGREEEEVVSFLRMMKNLIQKKLINNIFFAMLVALVIKTTYEIVIHIIELMKSKSLENSFYDM